MATNVATSYTLVIACALAFGIAQPPASKSAELLRSIPSEELTQWETRDVIQRAIRTPYDGLKDDLERIAGDERVLGTARFDALYGIWTLGTPEPFFAGLVDSKDDLLASFAVWLLASKPDAKTLERLRKLGADGKHLRVSVQVYEKSFAIVSADYREETDVRERVKFLLEWAGRGYLHGTGHALEFDMHGYLFPLAVFARRELGVVSVTHPEVVAAAISNATKRPLYRDHLLGFVSEDCAALAREN